MHTDTAQAHLSLWLVPCSHVCPPTGRYWADTRTCQDIILTHGDLFRFYEIGFRCCKNATAAAMA